MNNKNKAQTLLLGAGVIFAGYVAWRVYEFGDDVADAAKNAGRAIGNAIRDPGQAWRDYQNAGSGFVRKHDLLGDQYSEGAGNVENVPLTIATNNPGALRYSGQGWRGEIGPSERGVGGSFSVFDTAVNGARAQLKLMQNHISGRSGAPGGPHNTIQKLLYVWAPPAGNSGGVRYENSTESYIGHVVRDTGIDRNAILNPNDPAQMVYIARAMAAYEAGGWQNMPDDWENARVFDLGWRAL